MTRNVFTIPPGADFLRGLARGAKTRLGNGFSRALLLLPSRRACAHLHAAFLEEAGAAGDFSFLLPEIRPIGEVEEDELILGGDAILAEQVLAVPPAIDPARRRMLLTRLVEHFGLPALSRTQAFLLAGDLGRLIDDVLIEGCGFGKLPLLAPERYARHWQEVLKFLAIAQEHWPRILAEEGAIDAVDRRQRLLRLLAAHWRRNPPGRPVIAAGSTGSQPATAELLDTVAGLASGAVVLPGLDCGLEEEAWGVLPPSHPQYHMARLLKRLEPGRDQVRLWPEGEAAPARARLLSEVMRPPAASDRWRHLRREALPPEAFAGLELVEAAHEHEEALAAALILRAAAETGETAALVTPDRALARRVAGLMQRWGIALDDSAGAPLAAHPAGGYLSLLLDLPGAGLRPSQLVAFFKHPFCGMGLARAELLRLARHLEAEFFRAAPRGRGLAGWIALLQGKPLDIAGLRRDEALSLLRRLQNGLAPFQEGVARPFAEWLEDFMSLAESLCLDPGWLWQGEAGAALAGFVESHGAASRGFSCGFHDFAGMLRLGLRETMVRRAWGRHPRLAILGLLEARLLRFDHVILGGLNEDVWPVLHRADPWMSRAMRVDLGCADPDSRIGQAAHDFAQLAAGPRVTLLRSARKDGAPALPSRWLLRLQAVGGLCGVTIPAGPWLEWARRLDFCAEPEPCEPVAASVPAAAMPGSLSPSSVERWMKDPYAFYARSILRLKALGALDGVFSAQERGRLIHAAAEKLGHRYPASWPRAAEDEFLRLLREGLAEYGCSEAEQVLRTARLAGLAREYWQFEKARRENSHARHGEARGEARFEVEGYSFLLHARADRLEELNEGGLAILDYKTSALPSRAVREALRPQLYLEAILAQSGGFSACAARDAAELAYIRFDPGKGKVEYMPLSLEADDVEEIHRPGFLNFVAAFLAPGALFHAAPRPQLLGPDGDYARLARVAEWSKGVLAQEDAA